MQTVIKMSPANRDRLRKKLKYYHHSNQIGGYITPIEYLYIIEKFSIDNHRWERYLRDKIKKGDSTPSWYYFYLDDHAIERI